MDLLEIQYENLKLISIYYTILKKSISNIIL